MRKFLITMMCIIMVVCFMPTVAMAAGLEGTGSQNDPYMVTGSTENLAALNTLFSGDAPSETVYLKVANDFTLPVALQIPTGFTVDLDFAGHTITFGGNWFFKNYGTLTVNDSSGDHNGGIAFSNQTEGKGCLDNYGTATINGGTYHTYNNTSGSALYNNEEATMIINDCIVDATFFAFYNLGNATINGGNFTSTACNHAGSWAYCVASSGDLTFNNGYITGVQGGLAINAGTATIVNGDFRTVACQGSATNCQNGGTAHYAIYVAGEVGKATAEIRGGTFNSCSKAAIQVGNDNTNGDGGINEKATVEVKGGSFTSKSGVSVMKTGPATGTPSITGGKFSNNAVDRQDATSEVLDSYVPSGYGLFQGQDGSYTAGKKAFSPDVSAKSLYVGSEEQLNLSVGNEYVSEWRTSDSSVVTVENGKVKAVGVGSAVVTAVTGAGNIDITYNVSVRNTYIPPTTPTDNVTNSGTSGTDNATTSADLSGSTSTSNGTTSSTVDKTTADKIVDKAVENKSEEIVIDATANSTTAANSTTTAQVIIPTETLGAIAEKTEADVTIKTDVAEVKLDNASAAAVAEQAEGDTVQIIAEKVKEDAAEVHFELKVVCSDGKVISDFKGGNVAVTVALPKAMADKKVVCVYIDDNGHMSKVEGQKNADGTYTFNTGHFSSYAIMAEEEADAAIAAQKEAIKNIKIKLTSKQVKTKAGKKAVKITWTADAGDKVLDGVEVFRSTERYKGYGTEPFYTSTKRGNTGSYTNTKSLKKGTKYYYRVRGYVLVDGQKVYTDYSTKAWRTVK